MLTLRQWRFAYAGTVIHACAAEPLLVGQIKPPVLDSSRADRGACDDFGSIRKVTHAFGWRKLRTHTFADSSRVGIWGWSGGATSTLCLLFRSPNLYKLGMAVAPVPDLRLYDTIYQERYMGLPLQNVDGYRNSSAINFAEGLQGSLLLVHGSGDDNVHYSGSELLLNRLIELDKPVDFMEYPNRTHAISEGAGTTLHLYSLLLRYLEQHIPLAPSAP